MPDLDRTALLLDIDGTLIDLAPTPRDIVVPPALGPTLQMLHERLGGALALVRRPVADGHRRNLCPLAVSRGRRPTVRRCGSLRRTKPSRLMRRRWTTT